MPVLCIRNENGRLRMRSDINMEGPAYVGKKSSRSAVFENTDEEKLQEAAVAADDDDDEDDDDVDDLHLVLHTASSSCSVSIVPD